MTSVENVKVAVRVRPFVSLLETLSVKHQKDLLNRKQSL